MDRLPRGRDDVVMSGVVLLLALAVGLVSVIAVANLIGVANEQHERAGLFGAGARQRRLEVEALASRQAAEGDAATMATLASLVAELDRVAFAGVPLVDCAPTRDYGWWRLRFSDGTELSVQVGDPRAMQRVATLARKETIVVSRVIPHADTAVVELSSPRHRPVRVALRG